MIDSYSIVVRFNGANTLSFEKQIGSHTDIVFTNRFSSTNLSAPPSTTLSPRCIICLLAGLPILTDLKPLEQWIGNCPVLFSLQPDPREFSIEGRTRPFTTGTAAILFLLRLLPIERMFLTGFTLFTAMPGGTGHYWERQGSPVDNLSIHDIDLERRFFTKLIAGFKGNLKFTDDVAELIRKKKPIRIRRHLRQFEEKVWWKIIHILNKWTLVLRRRADTLAN